MTVPATVAPSLPSIPATSSLKTVAHESVPALTAVTLAGTGADAWRLLVEHLGWWELPNSLFVALGAVLFFSFRAVAKGLHARSDRVRERRDRSFLLELVGAGIVVPVPPNPYVREPVAVPIRAAGDTDRPPAA